MAKKELVEALKALMESGEWETKDDLMRQALGVRPSKFYQLTDGDAYRVLNRGNEIIMGLGKPPIFIEPQPIPEEDDIAQERKESVGRCVDLWKNDDILSDAPKKQRKRFGDPHLNNTIFDEPFLDGDLLPPKPIKREQYFGNTFKTFKIDLGEAEKIVTNFQPMWKQNLFPPTVDYLAEETDSTANIEVVGSSKTEEVEF